MGRRTILLLIIFGIFSFIFVPYPTKGEKKTDLIFDFEIIGYNGSVGLVGVPMALLSPNYTGMKEVTPPSYSLVEGQSYEFLVDSSP